MSKPQYGPEIIDRICEQLIEGKSLSEVCRQDGMPNRVNVWRWSKADDEIGQRIRDAWEVGFLCEGERIYREVLECEDPHQARAKLEAGKWYLGRRSAAYADKPLFQGAVVNVGSEEAFSAFAGALEEARAARASLSRSTATVALPSPSGSGDAAGTVADLAGSGGSRLGEDEDRG